MSDQPDNIVLQSLREMGQQRDLLLALNDKVQRLERRMETRFAEMDRRFGEMDRRIAEMREDLELMVKAEFMGRMANFETRYDSRLEALEARSPPA